MVLIKELLNNKTNFPTVTVELSADTVCDLHNILSKVREENSRYDDLSLAFTNIYEMLHHGFITDFGIYQNAKYFGKHDSFERWGDKHEKETNK